MADNKNIVNNPTQTNPKPLSHSANLHYPAWTNSTNHRQPQPRPTGHRYGNWRTSPPGHEQYRSPWPGLLGRPRPVQSPWQPTHHHEVYPYSATNNEQVAMHTLGCYPGDSNWYMDTGANFHMTSHRGPRPRLLGPRPVQFPWQPTHHHEPYSATNNEQVVTHTLGRYPADSNFYMDTKATFHATSYQGRRMNFSSKVAVKLLLKGVEEGKTKNMLTSPLSYNAIMNMIAAGSSNDTLVQILRFLEHKNIEEVNSEFSMFLEITREHKQRKGIKRKTEDEGITWATRNHENKGDAPIISFLNGAWLNEMLKERYPLKDSFVELVESLYKARIKNIDCTKPKMVVQEINEWANASTKGLIKEVLQEKHITPKTLLILGNALYFKGSWKKPFIKSRTRDDYFYPLNSEKIKVPFMTGCNEFSHKFFQDCKVARIPYSIGEDVNREFAMYIFLPYEKNGLQKLLKKVNSNSDFFNQHCDLPRTSTDDIVETFLIPKFKFSYLTEDGNDIMKDMGLTLPFDPYKAEFYEMVEDKDLLKDDDRVHVESIIQKAFIEVNEEGTEAAAVTFAAVFGAPRGCPPRKTIEFIADHPFMFIIREERSGILFFVGTLLNPLEA